MSPHTSHDYVGLPVNMEIKLILARTFEVCEIASESQASASGREQFFPTYLYEVSELTEVLCVVVLNLLPYNRSNTGRNSIATVLFHKQKSILQTS